MKRIATIFSLLLFAGSLIGCETESRDENEFIPEETVIFEDANFERFCIENFDYNGDGVFTNYEAMIVVNLNISGMNISSLKGIEHFTRLSHFNCSNNQLTSLDMTNSPDLLTLNCSGCGLTELNLLGCDKIKELVVSDNNLSGELSLRRKYDLELLDCSGTNIRTLGLQEDSIDHYSLKILKLDSMKGQLGISNYGEFPKLIELSLAKNGLSTFDTVGLAGLQKLYFNNNFTLSELDLSTFTKLKTLDLTNTSIGTLQISSCRELDTLLVSNCELNYLNLTGNARIKLLECARNRLKQLDVRNKNSLELLDCSSNELDTILFGSHKLLRTLLVNTNNLDTLALGGMDSLRTVICSGNNFDTLSIYENLKLTDLDITENNPTDYLTIYVWDGFDENKVNFKFDPQTKFVVYIPEPEPEPEPDET